jgi:hypothetical protein
LLAFDSGAAWNHDAAEMFAGGLVHGISSRFDIFRSLNCSTLRDRNICISGAVIFACIHAPLLSRLRSNSPQMYDACGSDPPPLSIFRIPRNIAGRFLPCRICENVMA